MGKKRKYTEQVGVMFDQKTLTQLDEITDEMEISKSEFVRKIIEEKLNLERLKEEEKSQMEMEQKIKNKERKLYDYFQEYIDSIDPAGPYEDDGDQEEENNSGKSPFEIFTFDDVKISWKKNGLFLVVEEKTSYEHFKDFFNKNEDQFQTVFSRFQIEFKPDEDNDGSNCKFKIGIDKRSKSELLELPFEQGKIVMEKLADAVIAYNYIDRIR